jgi:arylformamidase
MKIFDITLTITPDLPVWPGDLKVELARVKKMEEGSHDNLSQMRMGVHTGTHVDAPYHFVADGKKIDQVDLKQLIGPVQVVQIPDDVTLITAEVLKKAQIDTNIHRILFKTRNSHCWLKENKVFEKDFVGISEDAARFLVDLKMIFVGLDYLSVAPFRNSVPTHVTLLGAGMVLLEGADLSRVDPGRYTLYCLPLKLGATEGAPARVVLISE